MFRANRVSSLNLIYFIFAPEQTPHHTYPLLLSSISVFLHLFIVLPHCFLDSESFPSG